MTESMPKPSVYGVAPGADFVVALFDMLCGMHAHGAPESLARVQVLVPTQRMARRLKSLFVARGNFLLPKIGLVTDVSFLLPDPGNARAVSTLQRTLQLKPLVDRLIELDDRLVGSSSLDLTESLTVLLDEFQGEGVSLDVLETLIPREHAAHWERNLGFLRAIREYAAGIGESQLDAEALHRQQVEALCEHWQSTPPETPVILAGSTGSRATTQMLMKTVASLRNGAVVLPGYDFALPSNLWATLSSDRRFEDHPQYRFASFLQALDMPPDQVERLGPVDPPVQNDLLSLALRPAPVTHQWLSEGPSLGPLEPATAGLTLLEADTPKDEAKAIAIAIRQALADQKNIALIAPEATLARRVAAILARWNIVPDDSGGVPASLTPPGRFIRQIAGLMRAPTDPVQIFALLKHPYTNEGSGRGEHMIHTQEFEFFIRKRCVTVIDANQIEAFASKKESRSGWAEWLNNALQMAGEAKQLQSLGDHTEHLMNLARIFGGTDNDPFEKDEPSDLKVREELSRFKDVAVGGIVLSLEDVARLIEMKFASEKVRIVVGARPDVMIWGPMEARVQGADIVILSGLNEGTWPQALQADPWLNRSIRKDIGLLVPERQIGLAAHDFQQAVCCKKVILTRSKKSDGSETIPSRWLNRLTNLLKGLGETQGPKALAQMQERGEVLAHMAALIDVPLDPIEPERRPAPAPPTVKRPKTFAITEIQKLVRDPYAIYAKRILGLSPLDPFSPAPDARLKGTLFHKVLEDFYAPDADFKNASCAKERLLDITERVMTNGVPDLATQLAWSSQFARIANWLIEQEQDRRQDALPIGREVKGKMPLGTYTLRGTADRIDLNESGELIIYDYKSGSPPSARDIECYDPQLILEALMAEQGAFSDVPPSPVAHVAHIGLGRTPKLQVTELSGPHDIALVREDLVSLLNAVSDPKFGYAARRAMTAMRFDGDYDHLARFGEWADSDDSPVVPVE